MYLHLILVTDSMPMMVKDKTAVYVGAAVAILFLLIFFIVGYLLFRLVQLSLNTIFKKLNIHIVQIATSHKSVKLTAFRNCDHVFNMDKYA